MECRSDAAALLCRTPLIDAVGESTNFEEVWSRVVTITGQFLCPKNSSEFYDIQRGINAIAEGSLLVYHLVSHPTFKIPDEYSKKGGQILLVLHRLRELTKNHVTEHVLPKMRSVETDAASILRAYLSAWRAFLVSLKGIAAIFSSLSVAWAAHGFDPNDLSSVVGMMIKEWSAVIFTPDIAQKLCAAFQELAKNYRSNPYLEIDRMILVAFRGDVLMFLDEAIYQSVIEREYVQRITDHYKAKVASELRDVPATLYAKKCELFIADESCFAKECLKSDEGIVARLVTILVDDNCQKFDDSQGQISRELAHLRCDTEAESAEVRERVSVLATLLSKSSKGSLLLKEICNKSEKMRCDRFLTRTGHTGDGCDWIIQRFCQANRECVKFVEAAFKNSGATMAAAATGLRMSLYEAVRREKITFDELAKRLASHLSFALETTTGDNAQQMCQNVTTADIVRMFFFLPDEDHTSAMDVFFREYQRHLARRLLSGRFDAARDLDIIAQLWDVKQSIILFCCRSMLRDVLANNSGAQNSTASCSKILAISKGIWPAVPCMEVENLPGTIKLRVEEAQLEMASRCGQEVSLSLYSVGCVRVKLPAPAKTENTAEEAYAYITLSLLQLCISDAFNEQHEWNIDQLYQKLKVPRSACKAALFPLVEKNLFASKMLPGGDELITPGSCAGIEPGAVLNLIPLETSAPMKRHTAQIARTQNNNTQLGGIAVECQVLKALKEMGPLSFAAIRTYIIASPAGEHVRGDGGLELLKRVFDKLITRQYVERCGDGQIFKFCP